jgi:hypothetical protein
MGWKSKDLLHDHLNARIAMSGPVAFLGTHATSPPIISNVIKPGEGFGVETVARVALT